MEWPILTAVAALALAALLVGTLFMRIGEPLGYIPQCFNCLFFLKGPASLVQTNSSAYLVRGPQLTPSAVVAEYGWAYDGAGRPLEPGQSIYCENGIFVRVVDGLAQASCNNFSAPVQLTYSGYTPVVFPQPSAPKCNTSLTLTWPPPNTATVCFQNWANFSRWRAFYRPGEGPYSVSWTMTLKDGTGNTVVVTVTYNVPYGWGVFPYYCVSASENGAVLWIARSYKSVCFSASSPSPTVAVRPDAVLVTGLNPSISWLNPAVFPLSAPLAKGYLNATLSASGNNAEVLGASVNVATS